MCTAVSVQTKNHYFGRNLDLEYSYGETVTITPRNYGFAFRRMPPLACHYAMIGMAYAAEGYPLYYDAVNEKGLAMAALNFPGNAFYGEGEAGKEQISPFELIPWLLGQCAGVGEAKERLEKLQLVNLPFSDALPLTPLHWMISDAHETIVVEPMRDGLHIFENPAGVLTNNPPFEYQLLNLCNYMMLTREAPENHFSEGLPLVPYSRGMGAMGLPGDMSSVSRFVRAAFVRANSCCEETEAASVGQFFHLLSSVEQVKGCVRLADGKEEYTRYSSCCSTGRGIYYYKTYENSGIAAVDLHRENLDGSRLVSYPLRQEQKIDWVN